MPENEFENKVSSEMQELKFKPSEQVWLRVEERIRKKNKRRVVVIIFLLAGLALLGYWQRSNLFGEKKNDIAKAERQKENNSAASGVTNNSSTTQQNTETTKQEERKTTADKNINDKSTVDRSVIDQKRIVVSKNEINNPKVKIKHETAVTPAHKKSKTEGEQQLSVDVVSASSQKQNPVDDDKAKDTFTVKTKTETDVKLDEAKQTEVKPLEDKIDSAKAEMTQSEEMFVKAKDTVTKEILLKDSAAVVTEKKPSEKKWKWGWELTPGKSSLNDHVFSFNMNKSAAPLNNPNSSSSSGGGTAPAGPVASTGGFAFQAGGFAKKQLTSHSSISFGLRYAYYSDNLRIGFRMTPASSPASFTQLLDALGVNSAYGARGYHFYFNNQYHFIELPVNYRLQLNKNESHPLFLQAGFKVGRMFAGKALVYDTAAGGIYYQSKKYFNKTQFGLSTSLNWTLIRKQKFELTLGPVIDLHLNSFIDNPFEEKKHLFFAGLRTTVRFNSKK